jgi:hypothetical protein
MSRAFGLFSVLQFLFSVKKQKRPHPVEDGGRRGTTSILFSPLWNFVSFVVKKALHPDHHPVSL